MAKKIRCKNCGTKLEFDAKSCPVCYMAVERTEEEVEEIKEIKEQEEGSLKAKVTVGKIVMLVFIVVGLILTIRGVAEYQSIEFCTEDDCGFKSLFQAGVGIILMISAGVTLARSMSK